MGSLCLWLWVPQDDWPGPDCCELSALFLQNEPGVPPEKWQQKRIVRQKEKSRSNLLKSGFQFIDRFVELLKEMEDVPKDTKKKYLQKMLHAIFFFGQIHAIPIEPREFLPESHQDTFRCLYPAPFQQCTTHLPTKTPYSILLDYVTEVKRFTTPQELMSFLQSFNAQLWNQSPEGPHALNATEFTFTASVIACCFYSDPQGGTDLHHFYGASLSCKGLHERRIMIELSSIKTWHKAMAYAVHHGNTGLAITFPEGVWSQAFQFNVEEQKYQEKSPCGKCQQMFRNVNFWPPPNTPATGDKWQYGNCAEVESLSKLLLGTRVVEEGVRSTRTPPLPNSYEAIERDFTTSIEEDIKKSLIKRLRSRQFKAKTLQFFNLQ
ncbi:uncharacterized protein LOC114020301 [Chelonia mydas]|uniref:uncharacterized protein LOC114020301 n=1 Tax=Chelonia mydas TaxID=8469 RepID=UPI001CA9F712|nr:uncharacterized protein LOC114020301 [Chelonia mydas]